MARSVSAAVAEANFRSAFEALLEKAVNRVSGEATLIEPGLVDQQLVRLYGEMSEWPEAKRVLSLATRSPELRRLTWDAGGKPIQDVGLFVGQTVFRAVQRYADLASKLSEAPYIAGHSRRVSRITEEVVRWAKLDFVPFVTTTLIHGLRPEGRQLRFRVTPETVLRVSTDQEWEPLLRERFVPQPLCIETREELPRLGPSPITFPYSFLQALQLLLDHPVVLGDSRVRSAVPHFGLTNRDYAQVRARPDFFLMANQKDFTSREIAKARQIAKAFEDLSETGFDLALDLYVAGLAKVGGRERAVDVAIALENLYLGNDRDELTYRFQMHVAAYGRRLPEKERIDMEAAKALYNARSRVVHGAKPPPKAINLLNTDGARLVRSTLLSLISKRNRSYLQDIDTAVARLVTPAVLS